MIVLDTNVVLAAETSSNANSPNREIIRRWLAAEFLLLVTDDVLAEYADKLSHIGKSPQEVFGFLSRVLLLAEAVEKGSLTNKLICRTFSDCTTAPRNGLVSGCYPLDDFYRQRPEHETLEAAKRALHP